MTDAFPDFELAFANPQEQRLARDAQRFAGFSAIQDFVWLHLGL